jgi:NAD(P)-dependent dehydrogenase (short-subunit alcohol dehydrogenase family)
MTAWGGATWGTLKSGGRCLVLRASASGSSPAFEACLNPHPNAARNKVVFNGSALITGASGGIGRALAHSLAGRGCRLFLTSANAGRLAPVATGCGDSVAGAQTADLTRPGEVEGVVDAAWSALSGFDAVIHCAGVGFIKPALESEDGDFVRVMNVNARSTFLVAKAACARMAGRGRGQFVTIPGILGRAPMRNAAVYAASKYAVTGLIKCMAQELARRGVRFSLLHLGGVDSGFWDNLGTGFDRSKMIPASAAAELIATALDAPEHVVVGEIVAQPESHQLA